VGRVLPVNGQQQIGDEKALDNPTCM